MKRNNKNKNIDKIKEIDFIFMREKYRWIRNQLKQLVQRNKGKKDLRETVA